MEHATGTLTAADGTELFTRTWQPDGPVRAAVVVVHGIHEHTGRYAYLASALMRAGIEVHALDLRGHGQSGGERAMVETFEEYVADLDLYLDHVRGVVGEVPLFLLGHSMGGLVVASYVVAEGTDGLAGVALFSPMLEYADQPAWLLKLAPILSKWAPRLPAGRVDLSLLSRDPVVARAYREDPLNHLGGGKARLGAEMHRMGQHVLAHPEAFDGPLYLVHGTADAITSHEATARFAGEVASDDVTLTLYEGYYHETFREPERDAVLGALADWLVAHAEPAPA